jgi:hypothetical protein
MHERAGACDPRPRASVAAGLGLVPHGALARDGSSGRGQQVPKPDPQRRTGVPPAGPSAASRSKRALAVRFLAQGLQSRHRDALQEQEVAVHSPVHRYSLVSVLRSVSIVIQLLVVHLTFRRLAGAYGM